MAAGRGLRSGFLSGDLFGGLRLQAVADFVQVDQEAVDKGKDGQHDDAGHDEGIQVAGLDLGHGGSAHGRAAPGHDIHDGIGAADDGQQCFLAEAEALDDGQEDGHHDEESGGTGAVQMGHEGGQDDGDHDHHPAFAGLFGQEVDDRVKQELEKTKTGGRSAALVMNANPFTLGHQYLAETAAAACDTLHLFVVSEDASLVPFAVRKKLVAEGVKHLPNVILHDSGPYIISNATFPSYFLKDEAAVIDGHARLDLAVFTRIAKALNITARYVGEEPTSQVTVLERIRKAGNVVHY